MAPATHDGSALPALGGLLVDLVTPLRPDRSVDWDGMESLLLHASADRFDGVVPAGPAGEGPLLPLATRVEITRRVAGHRPGFPHVVTMALGTSPAAVVAELQALASAGATGALVSPLACYGIAAPAVAGFLAEVVDATPLPLVLYNAPRLTGATIPLSVVAELAGDSRVAGITDAGGDTAYLAWLVLHLQETPGFAVLCGDDAGLMPAVLVGACGAVTASANVVPALVADVYGLSLTRSLHPARVAQRRLLAVVAACHRYGLPGAWKAAASAAGLCDTTAAVAGYELSDDDARRLRAELAGLGVGPTGR